MKSEIAVLTPKKTTPPFKVNQAIIGLEANTSDKSKLRYFKFFTENISITSAFFIHVEPLLSKFEEIKSEGFYQDEMAFFNRTIEKEMVKNIEKYFSKDDDIHIKTDLKNGKPLQVLLETAENLNADLVVIGQKKGKKHHGILAKNFARKATGNALIIPEKSKCKINTILVPVDFSENSARALQTAIGIQKQLKKKAKLIALNIFQLPNFSAHRLTKSFSKFKKMIKSQEENKFKEFLQETIPNDLDQIEMQLLFKNTPNTGGYIYSFAADNNVDFMVMGAKGHSKLELLLMGSVTEKVLSLNQSFPTLIVK